MRRRKPAGHTTYWVYAYSENEAEYNFVTTPRLVEARSAAAVFLNEDGYHHGYIFWGSEQDGAFFDLDPVERF